MIHMISGIYAARKFAVRGRETKSSQRSPNAGIAQGCPLSPYVLVIGMPVLLQAVDEKMHSTSPSTSQKAHLITRDKLYADDTLLAPEESHTLQIT